MSVRGNHGLRAFFAMALIAAISQAAHGQTTQESFWITDGPVHALCWSVPDERLYVGGLFDRVGKATGAGARVDPATGQVLTPLLGMFTFGSYFASVRAAVADGVGGWFVGGSFSRVRG